MAFIRSALSTTWLWLYTLTCLFLQAIDRLSVFPSYEFKVWVLILLAEILAVWAIGQFFLAFENWNK